MKIFAAVFVLLVAIIAFDFTRIDYVPAVPNLEIKFKPTHLIGGVQDPDYGQPSWFESSTEFFRANPEYVQQHWTTFIMHPDYICAHQDICEAAGFKSFFTVRSYLHSLLPSPQS